MAADTLSSEGGEENSCFKDWKILRRMGSQSRGTPSVQLKEGFQPVLWPDWVLG